MLFRVECNIPTCTVWIVGPLRITIAALLRITCTAVLLVKIRIGNNRNLRLSVHALKSFYFQTLTGMCRGGLLSFAECARSSSCREYIFNSHRVEGSEAKSRAKERRDDENANQAKGKADHILEKKKSRLPEGAAAEQTKVYGVCTAFSACITLASHCLGATTSPARDRISRDLGALPSALKPCQAPCISNPKPCLEASSRHLRCALMRPISRIRTAASLRLSS